MDVLNGMWSARISAGIPVGKCNGCKSLTSFTISITFAWHSSPIESCHFVIISISISMAAAGGWPAHLSSLKMDGDAQAKELKLVCHWLCVLCAGYLCVCSCQLLATRPKALQMSRCLLPFTFVSASAHYGLKNVKHVDACCCVASGNGNGSGSSAFAPTAAAAAAALEAGRLGPTKPSAQQLPKAT